MQFFIKILAIKINYNKKIQKIKLLINKINAII